MVFKRNKVLKMPKFQQQGPVWLLNHWNLSKYARIAPQLCWGDEWRALSPGGERACPVE